MFGVKGDWSGEWLDVLPPGVEGVRWLEYTPGLYPPLELTGGNLKHGELRDRGETRERGVLVTEEGTEA